MPDSIRRSDDPRLMHAMGRVSGFLGGKVEYFHHNSSGYGRLTFTVPGCDSVDIAGSSGHGVTAEQAFHVLEGIENLQVNGIIAVPQRTGANYDGQAD